MAGVEGLEPPTYWFEARRSIQLSYTPAALIVDSRPNWRPAESPAASVLAGVWEQRRPKRRRFSPFTAGAVIHRARYTTGLLPPWAESGAAANRDHFTSPGCWVLL